MHLHCPHCTVVAIGRPVPRTLAENAFWTLSKHVNEQHRDQTFLCKRGVGVPRAGELYRRRDFWLTERNGDRTCSYCGSLHEDDFRSILQGFVEGKQGYEFAVTDKPDKIYAHRPGVRNPRDGGTKFFVQHVTTDASDDALHTLGGLFEQALKRLHAPDAISSE